MEYEPEECRWIIQGIMLDELTDPYTSIPWKLGIMQNQDNKANNSSDVAQSGTRMIH